MFRRSVTIAVSTGYERRLGQVEGEGAFLLLPLRTPAASETRREP